jgi:hypothetical protein
MYLILQYCYICRDYEKDQRALLKQLAEANQIIQARLFRENCLKLCEYNAPVYTRVIASNFKQSHRLSSNNILSDYPH